VSAVLGFAEDTTHTRMSLSNDNELGDYVSYSNSNEDGDDDDKDHERGITDANIPGLFDRWGASLPRA